MRFALALLALAAAFTLAERLRPARPGQPARRPQLGNDLFYLALHGRLLALAALAVAGWLGLRAGGLPDDLGAPRAAGLLGGRPAAVQFAVYLVVADLLQWCVHNLLHRVPLLWSFHKLHHSIHAMDWIGNFRAHWMEAVVYRGLLYLPLLLLGGDPGPLLAAALFSVGWGMFNHANLDVSIGPLGWLMNSPRMHLWHHDASDEGGAAKNFGVVFSLWDWLFGTAWWPRDRAPARIGYPGDEELPRGLARQLAFPLTRLRGADEPGA